MRQCSIAVENWYYAGAMITAPGICASQPHGSEMWERGNVQSRDGRGSRARYSFLRCPFVDSGATKHLKMVSVERCAVIAAARRCVALHPPANIAATECQRCQKRDQNENNERLAPANGHDVAFWEIER